MSVWNWIRDFYQQALDNDDEERLEMCDLFDEGSSQVEPNPELALSCFEMGRGLAQTLNEPWWVLLFDHWRLQVLLHFQYDCKTALDLAVQAALEARKPLYADFPQRVCLHEDLIYCYVRTDPEAHAEAIRSALEYMESEVEPDQECRHCIQGCALAVALDRNRLDEAESAARRALAMATDESRASQHHGMGTHADLCEIAARRRDWEALALHAEAAETLWKQLDRPRVMASVHVWQALLARQQGDEQTARKLIRKARRLVDGVNSVPSSTYYDALCQFHEASNNLEEALALRSDEITRIADRGLNHREVRSQVDRCNLLSRLGRLTAEDREAARVAARRLRDPAPWLTEIDHLP